MSDPRETFANERVAHSSLKGLVDTPLLTDGALMQVCVPVIGITASPNSVRLERQALFGEQVTVLEIVEGIAFGRCETNGYVGYLSAAGLVEWHAPSHRLGVRASFAFQAPDIKSPDPVALSFGSQVAVVGAENGFSKTRDGLFLPEAHLLPIGEAFSDPVATARLFLGTPYLWGGNSAFGIDCSGLVQAAFQAAGVASPGDSDQQSRMEGVNLSEHDPLLPGDLLFWKGHVALVSENARIIHANGFHMMVVEEDLEPALSRIAQEAGPITCRLRVNHTGGGTG